MEILFAIFFAIIVPLGLAVMGLGLFVSAIESIKKSTDELRK